MSDRVILLGGRPARIEDQILIELTTHGPRNAVSAREAPEFRGYHARIWNGLRGNVTARDTDQVAQPTTLAGAVHD
jgi:NitT/TauT family transport system ATP-binding protein